MYIKTGRQADMEMDRHLYVIMPLYRQVIIEKGKYLSRKLRGIGTGVRHYFWMSSRKLMSGERSRN